MVRLAEQRDLPQLTLLLLNLKAQTAWAQVEGEWNEHNVGAFLAQRLADPRSVLYVWDGGDVPVAFCGCHLHRFFLPPHMPLMFEWGLTGPPRQAVACWVACKTWAKQRGAHFACRATSTPGTHKYRIREQMTWEVL